ncbi:MAG: ferritin-like protein [Verrucomicrobiota bacterium]
MSLTPILTLETLRQYLYAAIQLEHATIPTYLTTLYSIHPGTNLDAVQVLRVVAVEEMLHMTLSANMLNAVGGKVDLTQPGFVPKFPTYLPNGETDFQVNLERFSPSALATFLQIERPDKPQGSSPRLVRRPSNRSHILPKHQSSEGEDLHFYSIGDFYHAIQLGLEHLCNELGEEQVFSGDRSRQITPEYYYSGGGEINAVYDLATAKTAIRLISEQGEGYEGAILDFENEMSHYYRFDQLVKGRYYRAGDVRENPTGDPVNVNWQASYPIKTNARLSDYPEGSDLYHAAKEYNQIYKDFLASLTVAFDGRPDLFIPAVAGMFKIKEKTLQLIRNPMPGIEGLHAAPTFEVE